MCPKCTKSLSKRAISILNKQTIFVFIFTLDDLTVFLFHFQKLTNYKELQQEQRRRCTRWIKTARTPPSITSCCKLKGKSVLQAAQNRINPRAAEQVGVLSVHTLCSKQKNWGMQTEHASLHFFSSSSSGELLNMRIQQKFGGYLFWKLQGCFTCILALPLPLAGVCSSSGFQSAWIR
jgi:hypothetical protein